MKKLIDNLISIIEKIEARKREKLDRTSQNIYPLNIAETQFQLRAGLNDAEIFDDIRRLIARKQAEFNNTF